MTSRIIPNPFAEFRGTAQPPNRIPWVWDSKLRQGARGLLPEVNFQIPESPIYREAVVMELNPANFSVTAGKRYAEAKVTGGSVFYHGVDERGYANDVLRLAISGSSGDIRVPPQRDFGSVETGELNPEREVEYEETWLGAVQRRFQEFWKLVSLSKEPELLSDGTRNVFYLTVVSPVFQYDVTFEGFFTSEVVWTESANQKGSVDWSCQFTVTRMTPDYDEYVSRVLGENASTNVATSDEQAIEIIDTERTRRQNAISGDPTVLP